MRKITFICKRKNLLLTTVALICFANSTIAQTLNFNWVKKLGNSLNSGPCYIQTDASGNIYISGGFIGTLDFDPGTGVFNLTSQNTTYGDHYLLKLDPNGSFLWAKQWNLNPTNNANITAGSLTNGFTLKVNQNGIFIIGEFTGTSDFNPGSGTNNLTANGTSWWDAFLLKLDLNGNYLWAQSYGGTIIDSGRDLSFDSNNNIYIIGYFAGTADFNFGTATNNLTSNGGADVFILKLDANGNFIWVKKIGGASDDDFQSIEIDAQNNIYFGGGYYSSSTIDLDPGTSTFNLTSSGNWDTPLVKLDANGDFLWAVKIGNSSQDRSFFKLNKNSNEIIIYGEFTGTLDIDPGISVNNILSNGGTDIYLLSLNSNGNHVWSKSFGGPGSDAVFPNGYGYCNLNFDSNGRIILTGSFSQSVDFDPGSQSNIINSSGLKDIFLSIFSATGNYITTKTFGGTGDDLGTGVNSFPQDIIYLTGQFSNSVDFDPNSGISNLSSSGLFDNYILKLNSSFCSYTTYDTVTVYNTVTVYDTVTTYISVTDTLIINTTLSGINPPNNSNTIKVFPNPANDHITIHYGNFALMNGYQLRIENSLGQQVFQTSISQQSDYLSLNTWVGNGIYFVHIIDPQGNTIDIRKIVLQ